MSQTGIPSEWLDRHPELREELAEAEAEARLTDAEALAQYDDLARSFIAKVDAGSARSVITVITYFDFKRLLDRRRVSQ